jgi:Acetyltransferase (GNAT) domain
MSFEIATASADDVLRIMGWAKDEGWNPANTDWMAFHAVDAGAFLIGRLDGEPVASISVTRYGAGFGFLGCYIARPVIRGKGYGIQIWNAGSRRLAGRNIGLDGVPAQQANYKKSGYRLAWNNARYEGVIGETPVPAGVRLVDARSQPFDKLAIYDRRFFPGARDSFLAPWITAPERASLVALKEGEIVGFGVIRAAVTGARIGPLYAASSEIAAALIGKLAAAMPGQIGIDMPDFNNAGTRLAEQLGLKPAFETARMYTGPDPVIDRAGLFGVASFELG